MLNNVKRVVTMLAFIAVIGLPLSSFATNSAAININSATTVELQNIKGVGPKMAEKIVKYREQHGDFKQVDELCQVQGIGEKSLARMANQVCVK